MKYTEGNRTMRLEGITQHDIKYSNMAGRYNPNNPNDQPDKPQHVLVVWIDDNEIADALKEAGFNVKEDEDKFHEDRGISSYLQFKAYPRTQRNYRSGKEELVPKVVKVTSRESRVLQESEFGDVDFAHINNIDISFNKYTPKIGNRERVVPSIDQLWFTVDETAGGQNNDEEYFRKKYAHLLDDVDEEEDEIPFE